MTPSTSCSRLLMRLPSRKLASSPLAARRSTVDSANEADGCTLTVKVAVKPEVKIGNYNGLTVEQDGPYCCR